MGVESLHFRTPPDEGFAEPVKLKNHRQECLDPITFGVVLGLFSGLRAPRSEITQHRENAYAEDRELGRVHATAGFFANALIGSAIKGLIYCGIIGGGVLLVGYMLTGAIGTIIVPAFLFAVGSFALARTVVVAARLVWGTDRL